MLDLNNLDLVMREYIKTNLNEIENYFKKEKNSFKRIRYQLLKNSLNGVESLRFKNN